MIAEVTLLPPLYFDFPDLLCNTENPVEFLGEGIHILSNLVIGDAGIDLSRGNPFMPQHLADCFQRYTLCQRNRCSESMSRHVHRRVERQTGMLSHMTQRHVHRPLVALDRKDLATRQVHILIAVVYLLGHG